MTTSPFPSALVLMAFCAAGAVQASDLEPTVESRAELVAQHICERCHGPGGRSRKTAYPILAGQQEAYLVEQIQAFRTRREEPEGQQHMLAFSVSFDDEMTGALA